MNDEREFAYHMSCIWLFGAMVIYELRTCIPTWICKRNGWTKKWDECGLNNELDDKCEVCLCDRCLLPIIWCNDWWVILKCDDMLCDDVPCDEC